MAELAAALDDALAGRGRMVMLVGEPGIGKTRTAEELAAVAAAKGAEVLWGRCPEDAGAPPFWPWAQVIRAHTGRLDKKQLQDELGPGAAFVGQVVPEIAARLPGPPPAVTADNAEQVRFLLFDAITRFLNKAASARPLLVILDNLHWSDGSSLRLLEYIAPEVSAARLLVVGTYRDVDIARGHPLFHTLGELTRQRLFQRVVLRGLGLAEVQGIIEASGAASPPPDLVAQIHAHTEGNPFFIREVVALLHQEGLLTA
jgi:predicted ATPase